MEDFELKLLSQEIDERKSENSDVSAKEETENEEFINSLFNKSVFEQAENNQNLKEKVSNTAEQYAQTRIEAIKKSTEKEEKKALFDNNKDMCECYGFDEVTTTKFLVNFMKIGYSAMSILWIIIGTFTFMPIIFVSKKLTVVVKKLWLAIVIAVLTYGVAVIAPFIMTFIK